LVLWNTHTLERHNQTGGRDGGSSIIPTGGSVQSPLVRGYTWGAAQARRHMRAAIHRLNGVGGHLWVLRGRDRRGCIIYYNIFSVQITPSSIGGLFWSNPGVCLDWVILDRNIGGFYRKSYGAIVTFSSYVNCSPLHSA